MHGFFGLLPRSETFRGLGWGTNFCLCLSAAPSCSTDKPDSHLRHRDEGELGCASKARTAPQKTSLVPALAEPALVMTQGPTKGTPNLRAN